MTKRDIANLSYAGPATVGAPFLPIARPPIDAEDIAEVVRVLESGWITSGAKVADLELALRTATGAAHAVAVNSATAGMHLLLHALGIGPGDEVITPSMTWVSTVNLIELCGATPVFVDVDRDTLMVSAERLEAAITPRCKLIVPVHFAGAPLDLQPLRELAARHRLPLVEDAAHALGTFYKGASVGSVGTSVFSLQAIKTVTSAEGGVICTDDELLAARLRCLRFHGLAADTYGRETQGRLPGADVVMPGYKCNLPDMNAALALGQMRRLETLIEHRAGLVARYLDRFRGIDGVQPLAIPAWDHRHAWHMFMVRLGDIRHELDRARVMQAMKERGIGTGIHFRPVHMHDYYRRRGYAAIGSLPDTEWNGERLITLPLFAGMQSADVDRVIDTMQDVIGEGVQ